MVSRVCVLVRGGDAEEQLKHRVLSARRRKLLTVKVLRKTLENRFFSLFYSTWSHVI